MKNTLSSGKRALPNLILAGMIGALLLVFAFWLSGGHLGLFPDSSTAPRLLLTSLGPYTVGTTLLLRGDHFSPNSLIVLVRDGQPATDAQGRRQALDTDAQGAFTWELGITADWQVGDHLLTAEDTFTQQRASVSVEIVAASSFQQLPSASYRLYGVNLTPAGACALLAAVGADRSPAARRRLPFR